MYVYACVRAVLSAALMAAQLLLCCPFQRSGTGVLVHCGGGIGRSGAVTVAAVMEDQGLDADAALALVKKHR